VFSFLDDSFWLRVRCEANLINSISDCTQYNMVLSSGKEDSRHVHVPSLGDTMLQKSDGGYVYLIRSTVFPEKVYIGCTENILFLVHEHNNGHGAQSVTCSDCILWCVISFIRNLGHLTKRERELLTSQWEF